MAIAPQPRLAADIRSAMKSGEKGRRSTLRMLLTETCDEEIRKGAELATQERAEVVLARCVTP